MSTSPKSKKKMLTTKKVVMAGLFAAVAGVLMCFEVPLLFLAPEFYKLDLSEVPVLILSFAYGPFAGVLCQLGKVLVKLLIKGTTSAFVGEMADFLIGCSLVLPAGLIYKRHRTKKGAGISLLAGTLIMALTAAVVNAVYLLPAFSKMYGIPLDTILEMGKAIPGIGKFVGSVWSFVFACVVPFNLVKGAVTSLVTLLLYKKLSPILKNADQV